MKPIDKKKVISSQSAEFIQQGEEGRFLKLIPDTFIIKMEGGAQGYAIRHLNRQDIILIDAIGKGAEKGIKHLIEEGYKIKGILLTHKEILQQAYASLQQISDDAGGAPIFTHPVNNTDSSFKVKDITKKHELYEHFSIDLRDFPANSGEAVVIYSGINEGMVFAGNSVVATPYDKEGDQMNRPDIGSDNKNMGISESWRTFMREFRYFFPYKGKPKFNLSEGQQKDLIVRLGNRDYPGGGNPNF